LRSALVLFVAALEIACKTADSGTAPSDPVSSHRVDLQCAVSSIRKTEVDRVEFLIVVENRGQHPVEVVVRRPEDRSMRPFENLFLSSGDDVLGIMSFRLGGRDIDDTFCVWGDPVLLGAGEKVKTTKTLRRDEFRSWSSDVEIAASGRIAVSLPDPSASEGCRKLICGEIVTRKDPWADWEKRQAKKLEKESEAEL